jgi:hypothetical protein
MRAGVVCTCSTARSTHLVHLPESSRPERHCTHGHQAQQLTKVPRPVQQLLLCCQALVPVLLVRPTHPATSNITQPLQVTTNLLKNPGHTNRQQQQQWSSQASVLCHGPTAT